ncbi:nitroreductase family protein [Tumebacillus sp. ITR2]|uniref:Nitroreductase family protein n=1 Tax=Tumebacillus amylolyticus TaxID=2801339 RepID=A0ABS1J6H4_9BACL|nr:nitroreductase family protein [Tumebacillus amylolyticus]MBL0385885.1 nitroreductase family protein [Tumebacillus amylolyticus]
MTQNVHNQVTVEQAMRERHAVKKYDASYTIPEAELNAILELAATSPSSWNLQHWKLVVITDQATKEKILPIAYGQQQVADASAVILVLGDLEANKNAEPVFKPALDGGFISQQVYDVLLGQIAAAYDNNPQGARDEAIRNSSYIAMQLMLAAKAYGYDTCPMGGFDKEKIVEALNVPSRYIPSVLISLGKAATPAHPSGRFGLDQIVVKNSF